MLFKTPLEILKEIGSRTQHRRLALNLSQSGLATQSGVSLGSIKRFENTGHIALKSLLKIALVLDCLDEFDTLVQTSPPPRTLEELMSQKKNRKKGRKHAL